MNIPFSRNFRKLFNILSFNKKPTVIIKENAMTTDPKLENEGGTVLPEEEKESKSPAERESSFKHRENNLPGEGSMSKTQIKASESMRDHDSEDLIELIGEDPFRDWEVRVWRVGPAMHLGLAVEPRVIMRMTIGEKWPKLMERIQLIHGGGNFKVVFHDSRGKTKKSKEVEISLPPKFSIESYPEFATANGSPTSEDKDIIEKKKELEIIKLDTEIKKMQGNGSSDLMGLASMVQTVMEQSNAQIQMMRTEMAENRKEANDRIEKMIQSISEKDSDKPGYMEIFLESQRQARESEREQRKEEREREREERKEQRERYREDRERQDTMFQTILTLSTAKKDDTNIVELLGVLQKSEFHKEDMTLKLFSDFMPLLMDSLSNDDPRSKMWDTILEVLKEGTNIFKEGSRLLPGGKESQKGIPYRRKRNAEPTHVDVEVEEIEEITPHERNQTIVKFQQSEPIQQFIYLFSAFMREKDYMPDPEDSLFVVLALNEKANESIFNICMECKTADDFHDILKEEITSQGILDDLQNEVFSVPDRKEWAEDCISFIHDVLIKEIEEQEEEIQNTPGESETEEDQKGEPIQNPTKTPDSNSKGKTQKEQGL